MIGRTEPRTGALSGAPQQPAIFLNRPLQGAAELDATPERISRMLREIETWQKAVRRCEELEKQPDRSPPRGKRYMKINGKLRQVRLADAESSAWSRARLGEHVDNIRHLIDYALTTLAYRDSPCPDCRLPETVIDFVRQAPDYERPAISCNRCKNRGAVRVLKNDESSVAARKRVAYFKRVLDDFIDCVEIRNGTSKADEAYRRLEQKNMNLLRKFSDEGQTSLEHDDAEQGVRLGIIDAARRFNPLRKEGAMFATVAYNWCRRNSRARHNGQKRAGVYAPSIETLARDDDGRSAAALIASSEGALGTFVPQDDASSSLVFDLRESVAGLPSSQRRVIELELSGAETPAIARLMNITTTKVRRLRELAYGALRASLGGYVEAVCD